MYKAETFDEDWLSLDLPFPAEVHHCTVKRQPDRTKYRVLTHYTEPRPLKISNDQVRSHADLFDLILTNEDSLLDLPNAKFALFGGCWIKKVPTIKRFELSFLYSNGIGMETLFSGYRMRRAVWQARDRLTLPTSFYTSIVRPPQRIDDPAPYPFRDKSPLFDSMFSVIIENDAQSHYFTEKIIDAIRSYTVPIYFGAPNIGSYFNIDGIIPFETPDNLIDVVQSLSPESYWQRMFAMVENFDLAQSYLDPVENLKHQIIDAFMQKHP
jgi:hypothetical protein